MNFLSCSGQQGLLHLPKISFCCEKSFVYILIFVLWAFWLMQMRNLFCYCEKLLSLCFTFDSFKGNLNSIYFFSNSGQDFPVILGELGEAKFEVKLESEIWWQTI